EVPTRRRFVRAATAVATISGEGRNPSWSWWCSPKKHESKPLASASWASAMTSSMHRSRCSPRGGFAIGLERPTFMRCLLANSARDVTPHDVAFVSPALAPFVDHPLLLGRNEILQGIAGDAHQPVRGQQRRDLLAGTPAEEGQLVADRRVLRAR